jgi:hypothetical protein
MKPGQWKPGQSGNPGGRPSEKVFTDLLRVVGNEIRHGFWQAENASAG